jgi:hypothetical protein
MFFDERQYSPINVLIYFDAGCAGSMPVRGDARCAGIEAQGNFRESRVGVLFHPGAT